MKLTTEQQRKVEANMGLVGKVIKDKVHGLGSNGSFTYDDLFQIGCIGLIKAAATDKGGCFSTYAYRLIWNEICNALIKATRISKYEICEVPENLAWKAKEEFLDSVETVELQELLKELEKKATGITAKGIQCLKLSAEGMTCKEIGRLMDAKPGTVWAWMSKARTYLQNEPELCVYAHKEAKNA